MYLFVLTSQKETLVASFREGRSTTTSFAHINALFPMKGKMIDRIAQFSLPCALWGQVPYSRITEIVKTFSRVYIRFWGTQSQN